MALNIVEFDLDASGEKSVSSRRISGRFTAWAGYELPEMDAVARICGRPPSIRELFHATKTMTTSGYEA